MCPGDHLRSGRPLFLLSEWKVTRQALRSNSGHLRSAAKISMETVSHPLCRLRYPIKIFQSLLCWGGLAGTGHRAFQDKALALHLQRKSCFNIRHLTIGIKWLQSMEAV